MAYSGIHINQLRQQILQSRPTTVPKKSGFYRWWFPADIAKSMLSSIPLVDINKIVKRNIGGKEYWLLYFGISTSSIGLNGMFARNTNLRLCDLVRFLLSVKPSVRF